MNGDGASRELTLLERVEKHGAPSGNEASIAAHRLGGLRYSDTLITRVSVKVGWPDRLWLLMCGQIDLFIRTPTEFVAGRTGDSITNVTIKKPFPPKKPRGFGAPNEDRLVDQPHYQKRYGGNP